MLAIPQSAEARIFNMKTESFATYFGASLGLSNLGDYAFGQSAGTGVSTDQAVRSNYSGEFGIVFTGDHFSFRLGGEYLLGKHLVGVNGTNAGGTSYYTIDSQVTAFTPMASAEFPIWKSTASRIQLGGGLGYAFVYLDQTYKMTPAGTAALGVSDYIEKASTQTLAWKLFISGETELVDTTTLTLELGYRSVKVGALQSSKDTDAIVGSEPKNSDLKNMDGSLRAFDLGGAYGSVIFRFYL
jgi:hypothetical protein